MILVIKSIIMQNDPCRRI